MNRSRRQSLAALAAVAAAATLPASRAQARKVRFGHQHPADSPIHKGLVKAAEVAAAKTGGRVQIELFPSSQLGSAREMMTQVIDANLDFIIEGPGALATLQRPLSIFEAPFLARDFDHLRKMLADRLGEGPVRAARAEPQHGQRRRLVLRRAPLHDQAEGAQHRRRRARASRSACPEAPLFLDMIRALNAAPTPMTLSEVYLALQTGVVDGQENPLPTINNNKFYEVQKYLNLTVAHHRAAARHGEREVLGDAVGRRQGGGGRGVRRGRQGQRRAHARGGRTPARTNSRPRAWRSCSPTSRRSARR